VVFHGLLLIALAVPPNAHLVAKGEFDALAAFELRHRLDDAVGRGCIHFALDLTAVTFADAGGLGTLVWLSNTVAPFGGAVAVAAARPRLRQLAALVGLGEVSGTDCMPTRLAASARRPVRLGEQARCHHV
jgi:anti-anti-sigma factor